MHLHGTDKWSPWCSCLLRCYLLNAYNGPLPPLHPPCVLLLGSSGACRVAWISYNNLSSASSITRKFSVIWRKHFLSASWRSPVWVVYCRSVRVRARVCGVVYSCGSSISGDSILIAQQPKEWKEKWVEIDSLSGIWCILGIICSIRRKCFVDGSVFTRGGVCRSEKVQHREGNKWEAIKSEMDLTNMSISICVALTVDEVGLLSAMEYLWISIMWNTLQNRHQLWGLGEPRQRPGSVFSLQTCLFFFLPVPASCRSTNEQVDVWLWLQHHLLPDEETRLRCVLLRSFLQPHFRAAAAAGRRLPSSAKGNADTVPSVPSIKRALCDYSRKPQVMCCAGNIWPDFGNSHMQYPVLFVIFTTQQHGSRQVTSYPWV